MTKTYQTYKESGVQWIGQVPEHWEMSKIKYLPNRNEKDSFVDGDWIESPYITNEGIRYLTSGNVGDGVFKRQGKGYISDETFAKLKCKYAYPGDLVFCRLNSPFGRSCLLPTDEEKYVIAVDNVILRTQHNKKFICYMTQCSGYHQLVEEAASGMAMQRISRTELGNIPIILPPLSEQQAIAEYLDKKTAKIDESVAALEAQKGDLQKYRAAVISEAVTRGLDAAAKMKDSGVEWIGEIPEGWKVSRLKHILTVNGRVGFKGYTTADLVAEGEGAYTIGGKHITNCVLDLSNADYISWSKYYESPEIMVHQGDIVMAQRGTLGKAALIREDIGPATINPSLVLLNQIKLNNLYLLYYLLSNPTQECIKLMNTATAVPMISQNQIENMPIPVPSLFEQQAIAEYLDKKTAKIDESIALIDAQIADLQAYRSTVISEAVTGKVKVS